MEISMPQTQTEADNQTKSSPDISAKSMQRLMHHTNKITQDFSSIHNPISALNQYLKYQ